MAWLTATMVAGSVLVAVAPNFGLAMAGRALQGVMVAAGPLTYSLMRDVLPGRLLALGASLSTTGIGLVTVAGPFLSGFLIETYTFRGVFWFLAVLAAIALVALLALVPESPLRLPARLDMLGGVLLGGGVALLLLGLTLGPERGWDSTATVVTLIAGVLASLAWWFHQGRSSEPLVDLTVVRDRPVWTVMVAGGAVTAAVTAAAVLVPLMVQTPRSLTDGYGFGVTPAGLPLYLVPAGLATLLGGLLVGGLARRLGSRNLLMIGAGLMGLGALGLAFAHAESWQVVTWYLVSGFGSGLALGAVPNLVIAAVVPQQQGVTAGMVSLLQSLGASAGVQLLFVVLALNTIGLVAGQPVYAGSSYTVAFVVVAAMCVLAIAAVQGTERSRRTQSAQLKEAL